MFALGQKQTCAVQNGMSALRPKADMVRGIPQRREEDAEHEARELQQKLARERIAYLLAQAKALDRANQIWAYVDSALLRVAETSITRVDFDQWAMWARQEADRIDPVKNGMIAEAIRQYVQRIPPDDPPSPEGRLAPPVP